MYCDRYCIFIDGKPSYFHRFRLKARILLMSMEMLDFSLSERMLLFKYFEKWKIYIILKVSLSKEYFENLVVLIKLIILMSV